MWQALGLPASEVAHLAEETGPVENCAGFGVKRPSL